MKIISGHKDYMDGICKTDGDYDTLWIRKTEEKEINIKTVLSKNFNADIFWWADIVGFAGELYPCRRFCNSINGLEEASKYNAWHDFNRINYDIKSWPKRGWFWYKSSDFIPLINHEPFKNLLFETYGPCFFIHTNGTKVVLNPRLESLGMAKVLPPQQAYMNIYRYLCNQKNPERPIPEMSNDIKVEQAGFDLKTSFRKEKSKKR